MIHGIRYHIPPLFDQIGVVANTHMHSDNCNSCMHRTDLTSLTYAQWARSLRLPPASCGQAPFGRSHSAHSTRREPSSGNGPGKASSDRSAESSDTALTLESMAACTDAQPEDSDRDDLDRWRRAWSIVVRRDILRQQRALVTQQREIFVTQKRSALAVQKEVRKRALRAQRVASNPQVQVRCKRIARDILTLAPAIETKLNARRASAELVGHMVSAIHCQGVRSADLTRMSAPRVAPLAGASSTRIGLGTIAPPALADRALLAATTESLATSVANAARSARTAFK